MYYVLVAYFLSRTALALRVTNREVVAVFLLWGRLSKGRIYLWLSAGVLLERVMMNDWSASMPMAATTARVICCYKGKQRRFLMTKHVQKNLPTGCRLH